MRLSEVNVDQSEECEEQEQEQELESRIRAGPYGQLYCRQKNGYWVRSKGNEWK